MWIIKILGSLMVVISCSLLGYKKGTRYRLRVKNLNVLLSSIRILETEIVCMSNPLTEALMNVYNKCNKDFSYIYKDIAMMLEDREYIDVMTSFKKSIEKSINNIALNNDDKEIFLSIGSIIGISNRLDQKKHLNALHEQVIHQIEDAKEEMKINEKLYNKLGVLIGVGIIIVLI
ncbi:hypothetical protein PV797_09685 [Clostridiaceae bacterium M8S5]|nr:hypothetical protein PV797_09685 [Clostridiaceae bacterium M8S5]